MPGKYRIALDAMGGDYGPDVVLPAAWDFLSRRKEAVIIVVGDASLLKQRMVNLNIPLSDRLQIKHASQVVAMDESPALAVRRKKDSSMRVAINLVKNGHAYAMVSAGNTGALMATAKFVLKTLPGIDRPAISTTLPSTTSHTHMLDLGANVDCAAKNLFQFAVMGSVLAEAVDNTDRPRVGLLNIGSEETKGNAQVKEADELLAASNLNYIGFVEGDDIYNGSTDVVVCDGFVGNVSLKTSEGVAKLMAHFMREEFGRSVFTRLAALCAIPVLRALKRRTDPRTYNGASLLGLQGIVIKSHGSADKLAYANAINIACLEVEKSVPDRINAQLGEFFQRKAI